MEGAHPWQIVNEIVAVARANTIQGHCNVQLQDSVAGGGDGHGWWSEGLLDDLGLHEVQGHDGLAGEDGGGAVMVLHHEVLLGVLDLEARDVLGVGQVDGGRVAAAHGDGQRLARR
jgi:hypothetical protein